MTVAKAGRELDALVTEKVMEWKRTLQNGWIEVWYPPDLHPIQNMYGHEIPTYSTDIAAAWQVVERLGNAIELQRCGGVWRFSIHMLEQSYEAEADTAPLAICLAALKACGDLTKEG